MAPELRLHAEEDTDEVWIDGGEVGLALIDGKRGEPSENGRSRVWVGIGIWGGEVVEGDMGSEGVDELASVHGGERSGMRMELGSFGHCRPSGRKRDREREIRREN